MWAWFKLVKTERTLGKFYRGVNWSSERLNTLASCSYNGAKPGHRTQSWNGGESTWKRISDPKTWWTMVVTSKLPMFCTNDISECVGGVPCMSSHKMITIIFVIHSKEYLLGQKILLFRIDTLWVYLIRPTILQVNINIQTHFSDTETQRT